MRATLFKYAAVMGILPAIIIFCSFLALCAFECTALPWLTLLLGPIISLLVVIPYSIRIYRKADDFADSDRKLIRIAVLSSILWAPSLSGAIFASSISLLAIIPMPKL
jgi:4-amino-4-deoxy-L-arabinose transferase-like glycosyltransferase